MICTARAGGAVRAQHGYVYATARTDYFLVGKGCVLLLGIKYNPSNDSRRNALCRNGTPRVLYANLTQVLRPAPETCVHTIKKVQN
jgi:hypothetical protein